MILGLHAFKRRTCQLLTPRLRTLRCERAKNTVHKWKNFYTRTKIKSLEWQGVCSIIFWSLRKNPEDPVCSPPLLRDGMVGSIVVWCFSYSFLWEKGKNIGHCVSGVRFEAYHEALKWYVVPQSRLDLSTGLCGGTHSKKLAKVAGREHSELHT